MKNGAHIPHEDLAFYAMQSLGSAESAAIREHLDECAQCRASLAEISGDLSLVAMTVDLHPVPEGARQRFLKRIGAAESGAEKVVQMPRTKTMPAAAWIPWAAAAVLALLAVGLGARLYLANTQLQQQSALIAAQSAESRRAHEVMELLTAPRAQHVELTAAQAQPQPTARAVYLASRGTLILEASNLKPVDADKTYELWLIPADGKAPIPAGVFRPDATGTASVVLPQLPAGVQAKAFGVTVEKAGGSATPTLPILLSGAAPASGE
jgi:anti-sigma-K factor RskA